MYMNAIGQITAITLGIKKKNLHKIQEEISKAQVNTPHYRPMNRGPNSKQQIGVSMLT